jgi:glycosyltransferase involved in cell wall biosynthesis
MPSSLVISTRIGARLYGGFGGGHSPRGTTRAGTIHALEISIVVPTRDRPHALGRCLTALARQQAGEAEVIVVDDGSDAAEAVAGAAAALDGARLIRAAGRGPAAARNLGARAASGELILFIDDDCEPAPGWARALAAAAGRGPAAGMTVNAAPGAAAAAAQAITNHLRDSSLDADGYLGFAPACNLAAPAELLERCPFDESYPLAAGEDREWCARVLAAGERIRFVPAALVRHRHEMGAGGLLRQQLRYGRGAARFHRSADGVPDAHRPRPGLYRGFARAGFAAGPLTGALVCAAQLATGVGFALERARPGSAG